MRKNRWVGLLGLMLLGPRLPAWGTDLMDDPDQEAFRPSWNFSLGLMTNGQPSDADGQGSQSTDLSFNATYEMTESGHYLTLGAASGRTKVEDGVSTYGSLSAGGGLGLGVFCPSLTFTGQRGEDSLSNLSGSLDLGFQLSDQWSLGVSASGGFSSVAVRAFSFDFAIDTKSWGAGASASFIPWDFLVVTLAGQQNEDITYRVRNLTTSNELAVDKTVRTPSLSLAFDLSPWDQMTFSLSAQRGQVFSPAGFVWRPDLGKFVQLTQDSVSYFWGYSLGVAYNFQ